jgi:hypothetical protein
MSHRASLAIRPAHAGSALDGNPEDGQSDNIPNGTYIIGLSEAANNLNIGCLHAVGAFREDVDHQLLVLRLPLSVFWIRVDDRFDIILDIFQLSSLVMY